MRRQAGESAACKLIPKSDYPKTGFCGAFELFVPRCKQREQDIWQLQ